ncbi:MAG: M56 family metallopeptidase, partial [Acidimicrobiales bacterium]
MIVGLLAVAGLGLLALPWLARPLGRRLAPSEWSRLCLLAIGAGAAAVEAAAVLLAAPTVLRALGVPALAASCQRMLGPLTPGGPAAGWAAAAVGVTIPVLGAIGVVRARRTCQAARVEPCLGEHRTLDEGELVVLPTPHVLAVSVAGPGGQVVVSEGLVNALSPAQLDLVISHEAAHLANDHHRYLTLATAVEHAFAAFPPARRSTAALRVALERWADEEATAGVP